MNKQISNVYGYYDDENQELLNYVEEIEDYVLPDDLKKINYNEFELKPKCTCDDADKQYCIDSQVSQSEIDELVDNIIKKNGNNVEINVARQKGGSVKIKHDTVQTIELKNKRKEYILNNKDKIIKKLLLDIQKGGLSESTIAGVALYLARGWNKSPMSSLKFGKHNRGHKLPETLDSNYPQHLKKAAYHASINQIKEFDNHEHWDNEKLRLTALKNQAKLFKI